MVDIAILDILDLVAQGTYSVFFFKLGLPAASLALQHDNIQL